MIILIYNIYIKNNFQEAVFHMHIMSYLCKGALFNFCLIRN